MVAATDRLDGVFAALADPTRRSILARLARGSATVTEVARPFRMSLPAISKHLKALERAGLLGRRIDGRVHHCSLEAKRMKDAAAWINRYRAFWEQQFELLEHYLESAKPERVHKPADKTRKGRV